MPLPLGHAAIGFATHHIISNRKPNPFNWKAALLIIILSNLPDMDVILGLLLQNDGCAFHRGPTHSILFALGGGYAIYKAALWFKKTPILPLGTGVAVIFSHLVADHFFTTAPVSFFWPFEVHWSAGNAQWQQVLHAVFFEAATDGAIVLTCAGVILVTVFARRCFDIRFLRSARLTDDRAIRRYKKDALPLLR